MIVAIDGPAGAGKSSVARLLARRLGFRYLDTGAMYRAATWLVLREGIDPRDGNSVAALLEAHPVSFDAGDVVRVDGTDVTDAIRTPAIDKVVTHVARHPSLRRLMRERQRSLADAGDSVIEGRDIGVVVVPHADVKVWLDADPDVRARRRHAERPAASVEETAADLRLRDQRDAVDTHVAPDAVVLDTTDLSLDEVVGRIEKLVLEARAR